MVAGHKGQPDWVRASGRRGRRRRLKGARGRGSKAKDKPPILGLIERGGPVVLRLLADVKQPHDQAGDRNGGGPRQFDL